MEDRYGDDTRADAYAQLGVANTYNLASATTAISRTHHQ